MEEVKAYKCSYCKKLAKSKSTIWRHEKKCYNNPEVKTCNHCDNQITVDGEYFCSEFAKYMYEKPYHIKCKRFYNFECLVPIPFTCECFIKIKEETKC